MASFTFQTKNTGIFTFGQRTGSSVSTTWEDNTNQWQNESRTWEQTGTNTFTWQTKN